MIGASSQNPSKTSGLAATGPNRVHALITRVSADYKFRGAPVSIGGNLGWTPAYTTQQTDIQSQALSTRRVFDAYALWTISPSAKLRLSLANIVPVDQLTQTTVVESGLRQVVLSTGRSDMSVALRLEMRL